MLCVCVCVGARTARRETKEVMQNYPKQSIYRHKSFIILICFIVKRFSVSHTLCSTMSPSFSVPLSFAKINFPNIMIMLIQS